MGVTLVYLSGRIFENSREKLDLPEYSITSPHHPTICRLGSRSLSEMSVMDAFPMPPIRLSENDMRSPVELKSRCHRTRSFVASIAASKEQNPFKIIVSPTLKTVSESTRSAMNPREISSPVSRASRWAIGYPVTRTGFRKRPNQQDPLRVVPGSGRSGACSNMNSILQDPVMMVSDGCVSFPSLACTSAIEGRQAATPWGNGDGRSADASQATCSAVSSTKSKGPVMKISKEIPRCRHLREQFVEV